MDALIVSPIQMLWTGIAWLRILFSLTQEVNAKGF